jgi:ring-1,2-phenylacetyl-CoA epoxidase subunit PaaE
MKFHHLQVKEVVKETSEAISIHFWHPLAEQIKYKAGQFITLCIPIEGKKIRRSYSMSSSPHADTSIAVTVKRVDGGLVSNWLNDNVKVGDFIEIIEPMGNFHIEPDSSNSRHAVLFAAGSGVTPLISIAKSILKMEPNSRVSLVYGNRSEDSIIFKAKLEELENQYGGRFKVAYLLSRPSEYWVGEKGHINQAKAIYWLKEFETDFKKDEFYLCGPVGMMDSVITALDIYEIPKNRIHKENFHAPVDDENIEIAEEDESLQTQTVKVKYEGEEYEFEVKPHQTVLEAALDLDIDLPYSCQAGMCTACMGKCVQGKIKMDEEDGLTEKEIKQGFILTCVSHPLTKDVVIEID